MLCELEDPTAKKLQGQGPWKPSLLLVVSPIICKRRAHIVSETSGVIVVVVVIIIGRPGGQSPRVRAGRGRGGCTGFEPVRRRSREPAQNGVGLPFQTRSHLIWLGEEGHPRHRKRHCLLLGCRAQGLGWCVHSFLQAEDLRGPRNESTLLVVRRRQSA